MKAERIRITMLPVENRYSQEALRIPLPAGEFLVLFFERSEYSSGDWPSEVKAYLEKDDCSLWGLKINLEQYDISVVAEGDIDQELVEYYIAQARNDYAYRTVVYGLFKSLDRPLRRL